MKKFFIILSFLVLISYNCSWAETITVTNNNSPLQVSTTSPQVLALIPSGTTLEALNTEGNFLYVTYNNQKGFIATENSSAVSTSSASSTTTSSISGTMSKAVFYSDKGTSMKYWIYVPENVDSSLPLIIYLHGVGECGTNLDKLISAPGLPRLLYNKSLSINNAIVLMPQASSEWGFSNTSGKTLLYSLMDEIVNTYNIDTNKISIVGFSRGARNACGIIAENPNTFSAFVAISGASDSLASSLTSLPVRGYWGTEDSSSNSPKSLINKILKYGGNATFTELSGVNHSQTPETVFLKTDTIQWLISQSK